MCVIAFGVLFGPFAEVYRFALQIFGKLQQKLRTTWPASLTETAAVIRRRQRDPRAKIPEQASEDSGDLKESHGTKNDHFCSMTIMTELDCSSLFGVQSKSAEKAAIGRFRRPI